MSRFSDTVRDELGRAIPDVLVYVYEWDVPASSTGLLSALVDDDLTTALPNPLGTDEFGQFYFNASDGVKLIEFHYAGKLLYREQIILTPAGFYPGNDATLRADLAATGGSDLVNLAATPIGSTGTPSLGTNIRAASTTEAASGDLVYFGRSYTGAKAIGASGVTNLGYGPGGYMFDLRYDNADAGADFVRALYGRTVFGGSAAKGGRIGVLGEAYQQLGATNAANANRNYVGVVGQGVSDTGDGGTNTGAGALGAVFGMNGLVMLRAGATNLLEATAVEFNTLTEAGSSVRYLFGATIVGSNEVRGSEADAALEIGAGTQATFGPHIGFKHGILFSDIHGELPLVADSTLLGSYWSSGGAKPIANGLDLSGFDISGAIVQGQRSILTESSLTLGADGSNVSLVTAGNGVTNATMIVKAKGTGGSALQDGGGSNRVMADSGVGVRLIPKASATPANNGDLAIEATSNTTLTFRFKGSDGVVRSGTVTLS